MAKRLISLHPRLAAAAEAVVAGLLLWWIRKVSPSFIVLGTWFALRLGWWLMLTQLTYYPPFISRWRHWAALNLSSIGALAFLVFSDASTMQYVSVLVIGLSAVSFFVIPARTDELSVMVKPHRRTKLFLSLFGVAGLWLTVEASAAFQIITGWEIVGAVAGAALLSTAVSLVQWQEYNSAWSRSYFLLGLLIFALLIELALTILLWPVGYLVATFFISWWWYILSLMFRFYLSRDGINWPRQRTFLFLNGLAMLIFLVFIVRWK